MYFPIAKSFKCALLKNKRGFPITPSLYQGGLIIMLGYISKPKPNDTRFLDILDTFSLDMSYISPNLLEKTFTTRQHAFQH